MMLMKLRILLSVILLSLTLSSCFDDYDEPLPGELCARCDGSTPCNNGLECRTLVVQSGPGAGFPKQRCVVDSNTDCPF